MVGLEEFSRFVSQIYASPATPAGWDAALADLTRHLDATACTVTVGAGSDRSILSTSIEDDAASAYASYYHQMDFIMKSCESGPVGLVRSGRDGVTANACTEFYTDWQRRFDMTDGLFVRLSASDPSSFIVSAPPCAEPYATGDRVRFVNALVPHLQQALATRRDLLDTDLRPADITAAADVLRQGIVVVAAGGRIVQTNTAARQLASTADGLRVRGERIQASITLVDSELQAGIAKALVRQGRRARVSSYVLCRRPSGKRPYVVRILPLDTHDDPALARAAIVIIDPDQKVQPPKALLRQLFNLTEAECRVALQMLFGDGPQAIADKTAVSITTVKTQIQSIFRKTGTHRQAELVRLLVAIVP